MDLTTLRLAKLYYQIGKKEKGDLHCGEHAKLLDENIVYFVNQNDEYVVNMITQCGEYLSMFDELTQGDAKFKPSTYNETGYNALKAKVASVYARSPSLQNQLRSNIYQATQNRGRVPLILPYNFIKDTLP